MEIRYSDDAKPTKEQVLALYRALEWSAAKKPQALYNGLLGSHSLVTAWRGDLLLGVGNAISDGHLVVYFPHLLVIPKYQTRGVGTELLRMLLAKYHGFHQQVLLADERAVGFYAKRGFSRAGSTLPMWIYGGDDHS